MSDIIPLSSSTKLSFEDLSNCVICIDDLERINPKTDLNEIFGAASMLVSTYGARVIFLANQSQIPKELTVSYDLTKEKIIGKTYKFKPDIETFINIKLETIKELIGNLLRENANLLVELSLETKQENLRTVSFIIDALCDVLIYLVTTKEEHAKRIVPIIIRYTYMECDLYKKNVANKKDVEKPTTEKTNIPAAIQNHFKERSTIELYYRGFAYNDYYRFPSISAFVVTGYLDIDKFKKEYDILIDTLFPPPPPKKFDKFVNLLTKWRDMSDSDFENSISEVIALIKSGEGDFYSLYTLNQLFNYFFKWNGISMSLEELNTLFENATESMLNEFMLNELNISKDIEQIKDRLEVYDNNIVVQMTRNHIDGYEFKIKDTHLNKIETLFDMNVDDIRSFISTTNEQLGTHIPIFQYIKDVPQFVEKMFVAESQAIQLFHTFVKERYRFGNIYDYFCSEKKVLSDIFILMEQRLSNSNTSNSARKVILRELLEKIKEVFYRLSEGCPSD